MLWSFPLLVPVLPFGVPAAVTDETGVADTAEEVVAAEPVDEVEAGCDEVVVDEVTEDARVAAVAAIGIVVDSSAPSSA